MQIVAINATDRKNGTTTELTERALEGAASRGAATEMILLMEKDIRPCNNCLRCYRDQDSLLAPCGIQDDMTEVLEQVQAADGVILASPIHNGFVSSRMVIFFERLVWRMCRPGLEIGPLKNCPAPRSPKVRALATIVSAGGIPDKLRRFCDGTPWMKENGTSFLNAHWVGDSYAAAHLPHQPGSKADWDRMYFIRKLSRSQLRSAHDLGVRMADDLARGGWRPCVALGPAASALTKVVYGLGRLYRTVDDEEA